MNPFDGYRISSPYGPRKDPFTGQPVHHTGIDLVKFHQAPIYAFMPGMVVHAREGLVGTGFGGFGNVVAIKDSCGAIQFYAHLDSTAVKVGQQIMAGQMIGRQGTTGRSTGSHLHFEVRLKSTPSYGYGTDTNPGVYLERFMPNVKELGKVEGAKINMDKKDADKIILFLSAAYGATASKDAQAEFHRLANELRKASGQAVQ
ncbi:M23 family metallopeptidase [Paenibacillus eucommiae]|uniref:Murein DD-endopeptidase MepM/ murein hydrolase activator NlpD n=1 Tax=Paenibacillus eucommiae TaxID=1355755 RepID=A0ABS4ITI9_9BACL|nr:M23 family metallopeptidase [Paenibacillus eucommiae]MBP1990191.1 murein DD-endopeptidase MepM/ murein hydrolase activator NlpD [Paenibacillus eucommiae]